MFKIKFSLIYLLPAIAGLIAYFPSLKYSFAQDDFIHLYWSRADNLIQFLNFFNPFAKFPDIFFYRPLTTQVYFFTTQSIFGLNPIVFHLEAYVLHIINAYLFYLVVRLIWDKKVALISSIFYSLSSIHFLSLYYISASQELGKTFFVLLSLILFEKFLQKGNKLIYLASIIAFIGALLSKETAVILPILLIVFEIFRRKSENWKLVFKQIFKKTIPYFLVVSLYGILRLSGFHEIFNQGYSTTFSAFNLIQNIKWYLLWSFGLPEIVSTYPNLHPESSLQFVKDFNIFGISVIVSFLVFIAIMFKLWLRQAQPIFTERSASWRRVEIFLLFMLFFTPLLPVLFLDAHRYPQYLDLSLIAFLPLVVRLLIKEGKIIFWIGIVAFVTLQFLSLNISEQSHWATHRAKVADYYKNRIQNDYPKMEVGSTVVFLGTFQALDEVSVALGEKYALKVWYPGVLDVLYLNDETPIKTINKVVVEKVEVF